MIEYHSVDLGWIAPLFIVESDGFTAEQLISDLVSARPGSIIRAPHDSLRVIGRQRVQLIPGIEDPTLLTVLLDAVYG